MHIMTPSEELHLYKTNRAEWARYMAPRWRSMPWTEEEKRANWQLACPELRAELSRLKAMET
jgi:hypothetical protein